MQVTKSNDLHNIKLARSNIRSKSDLYQVVPDDYKFGVAFKGLIIMHGLDFQRANFFVKILNGLPDVSG